MTDVRIVGLRTQLAPGLIAIGRERPRLSWQLAGGSGSVTQRAYEVQGSNSARFEGTVASTGEIAGAVRVGVPVPGDALASREVRFFRVRARTDEGLTPWSDVLPVEASLLEASDWEARAISLADDPGQAVPILRHEFELDTVPLKARLYVTSLGLNHVRLDGMPVDNTYLAPGWTSYRHRILVDTYDLTDRLGPGHHAIGAVLGDGWYRGRLGWTPGQDRGRYGTSLGLLLQLELELPEGRRIVVSTDPSWRAATGELESADLYDGTTVDLRSTRHGWDRPGFDDSAWAQAAPIPIDLTTLEPRMAPRVRAFDVHTVDPIRGSDGRLRIDRGQNLSGFVRLHLQGSAGDRVSVRHAEVLEADGALHTKALRSARATDTYVLADDEPVVVEPMFTSHGFRYAEVETSADVTAAEVVAISSDLPTRSTFASSDERLNRLHSNVLWSLRGNFVSLPTDCPQRDERLGWTGDAQAFAATSCTLVESDAFWQSWLRDLELDQDDELGVPSVVPDVVLEGAARFGRAGWADAATIVPWAVYESYGDLDVLRRQFPSMRRWIESLMRRRGSDGLLEPSWQFGDWLDPDAPVDRPWEAKCDSDYIANSYFSWSARLTADAADAIGERAAGEAFRALADRVADITWTRWSQEARRTQTGCAIAIVLQIAPMAERITVGDALGALVDAADGRVATGFLGTPLVLPALSAVGRFDSAYKMLLRSEAPSWLYQIKQGATTVWERWDAIRPDGSIHPGTMTTPDGGEGHMLSFNHYAYGAVIDWVYRHVAGIAPDRDRPGYEHIVVAPRPAAEITWAAASIESPYGTVAIDWRLEAGDLIVDLRVPPGATATFDAPVTASSSVSVDGRPVEAARVELADGAHRLIVKNPAVVGL